MKLLIIIIFSFCFNSFATDISSWESKIEVPENVLKLKNIKDKKSVNYEIVSYEAAVDLVQLARVQRKIGNTVKSLHFISLAASLFPYRDDIVNTYKSTLDEYTNETNKLISSKRLSCNDLKKRISLLSSLSPKSVQNINQKSVSCEIKIEHTYKSLTDIDINQWIKTSLPKRQSAVNASSSSTAEDSIYFKALKAKEKKLEQKRLMDKVYTLKFPKLEIILSSLKVLGNFSLDSETNIVTDDNGNTFLKSYFNLTTDSTSYGIDGHCNSINKFFKLPEEYNYGSIVGSYSECGLDYSPNNTSLYKKSIFSNWNFSNQKVLVMREGDMYNSDSNKSKTPLYMFFPRKLDMYVKFIYNSKVIIKDFQFKIENLSDFIYWFNLGNIEQIGPPKIINNKAKITLSKNNFYSIPVKDLKVLKGLKRVEIKFNSKKTFNRLVKELDVKRK